MPKNLAEAILAYHLEILLPIDDGVLIEVRSNIFGNFFATQYRFLYSHCELNLVNRMSQIIQIGKKNAVYLPKHVVEKLDLKEGDKLILEIRDDTLILKPIKKFLRKRRMWASVSVEEIESVGEEISREVLEGGGT